MSDGFQSREYTFKDHDWLANMAGFNKPIDVYRGTIMIGVIESRPIGYVIIAVMGQFNPEFVQQSSENMFKTKERAAEVIDKLWCNIRKTGFQKPGKK